MDDLDKNLSLKWEDISDEKGNLEVRMNNALAELMSAEDAFYISHIKKRFDSEKNPFEDIWGLTVTGAHITPWVAKEKNRRFVTPIANNRHEATLRFVQLIDHVNGREEAKELLKYGNLLGEYYNHKQEYVKENITDPDVVAIVQRFLNNLQVQENGKSLEREGVVNEDQKYLILPIGVKEFNRDYTLWVKYNPNDSSDGITTWPHIRLLRLWSSDKMQALLQESSWNIFQNLVRDLKNHPDFWINAHKERFKEIVDHRKNNKD